MNLKHGDRVQWQEGGASQYTCTGNLICESKHMDGSNPLGFWEIHVEPDSYLRACHTAREMGSHMVCRSVELSKVRPFEVSNV